LTEEEMLNRLLVHGVVHLMGYDHVQDDDTVLMEAREDAVLAARWVVPLAVIESCLQELDDGVALEWDCLSHSRTL
jgi:hypothetical protein